MTQDSAVALLSDDSEVEDPDKELNDALMDLIDELDKEEKPYRDLMLRDFKELHLFWQGIQTRVWDDTSRDWVNPSGKMTSSQEGTIIDKRASARIINIYRAHGESIIAALTTGVPKVSFFPFNADSSSDVTTAKGFTKLGDKIQKDNDIELTFIYALFLMFNEGLVFAYNYYEESEEHGYDENPITEKKMSQVEKPHCLECGSQMDEETEAPVCPDCGGTEAVPMMVPQEVEEITGYEKDPYGKECIQIYGELNVTVPHYVKKLKDSPYLKLEQEVDPGFLMDLYPTKAGLLKDKSQYSEDRWVRKTLTSSQGGDEKGLLTNKKVWLRSSTLNRLKDETHKEELKRRFPEGVLVTAVENIFISAESEALDKHWTATESPIAVTIHADPLGKHLKPLQRIENELAALGLDTIRSSIGDRFADPKVVDFDAYAKGASVPGTLNPAEPNPGENLSNSFHEVKGSSLSQETIVFQQYVEKRQQFVSGALPSIYGGNIQGSRTAHEYETAKGQALQRLSIPWKTLVNWWTKTVKKSVEEFADHLITRGRDVREVKQVGGAFTNETIKFTDLAGKVGKVISESSEQFPLTKVQMRDILLQLFGLNKEPIDNAIYDPANVSIVADTLGFPGFEIPGNSDRQKQLRQITQLLQETVQPQVDPATNEPIIDQMTGQPAPPLPSIMPDPNLDNMQICIATIKLWANSEEGEDAKVSNPQGYENVMAQLQQRVMMSAPPPMEDPNAVGPVTGEGQ